MFRLSELCALSNSVGGAVCGSRCRLLLAHRLNPDLLERIRLFIEWGQEYGSGLWFSVQEGSTTYSLVLMGSRHPSFLDGLVQYFRIWKSVFRPS